MRCNDSESLIAVVRNRLGLPDLERRLSIRESAGVSATEMARVIGCTRQAVRNWETGRRTPRGDHLTAYADLLNSLQTELEAANKSDTT